MAKKTRVLSAQSLKVRSNQSDERMNRKLFVHLCAQERVPVPTPEFKFAAPDRQWRFDFAWEQHGVALEVEGGAWVGGAHVRGAHFLSDLDKYNCATLRGWRVLRCVPTMLLHPDTLTMIRSALTNSAGDPRAELTITPL